MPIDINSLRTTRGGNPDAVRKTQQARFKSVEIVDEVIALDDVISLSSLLSCRSGDNSLEALT